MLCITCVANHGHRHEIVTAFLPRFDDARDASLAVMFLADLDVDAFITLQHSDKFTVWVELTNYPKQWVLVGDAVSTIMEMFE